MFFDVILKDLTSVFTRCVAEIKSRPADYYLPTLG